jgi:hypothetical protein
MRCDLTVWDIFPDERIKGTLDNRLTYILRPNVSKLCYLSSWDRRAPAAPNTPPVTDFDHSSNHDTNDSLMHPFKRGSLYECIISLNFNNHIIVDSNLGWLGVIVLYFFLYTSSYKKFIVINYIYIYDTVDSTWYYLLCKLVINWNNFSLSAWVLV